MKSTLFFNIEKNENVYSANLNNIINIVLFMVKEYNK